MTSDRTPSADQVRRDCVLCRVVRGELQVDKVIETEGIVGMMARREALSRGHCVFFPKVHAQSFEQMDNRELAEILVVMKRVAWVAGFVAYNILQNNGALAGQTVFHAHFHMIPKWRQNNGLCVISQHATTIDHGDLPERIRRELSLKRNR